jgi:hypothetical protein
MVRHGIDGPKADISSAGVAAVDNRHCICVVLLSRLAIKRGTNTGRQLCLRYGFLQKVHSLFQSSLMDLSGRRKALDDLVQYVKTFPNKSLRRKHNAAPTDHGHLLSHTADV